MLFGIITFSHSIYCSPELLGEPMETSIGRHECVIIFPSLPENIQLGWGEDRSNLLDPETCPVKKKVYWGDIVSSPSGESYVKRCYIEFKFQKMPSKSIISQIYKGFDGWASRFEDAMMLLTEPYKNKNQKGCPSLELGETFNQETSKRVSNPETAPIAIEVTINDEESALQPSKLKDILLKVEPNSNLLKLEFKLLIEAYYAFNQQDFRKAIVEAASSLEVCLISRVKREFQNLGISFGDEILKKYRMLTNLFELVKILGIDAPDINYKDLIIKPRNAVVHKADFSEKETAMSVLKSVEEYLFTFEANLFEQNR